MYKKQKPLKFFSILAVLGMLFGACDEKVIEDNKEIFTCENELDAGKKEVKIAVLIPRNGMNTYAAEDANEDENHIDTLYVKIFEDHILKDTKKFYGTSLTTVGVSNDSIVHVDFEIDNLGNGIITAEVFANRMEITPVTGEIPLPDRNDAATLFMMSGSGTLKRNGAVYSDTIHVARNVAKLRVRINKHASCIPDNLIIRYDQIKIETKQVPDRTQLLTPPPVSTPPGMMYLANYSSRTGNALRAESPINVFAGGQIDSLYLNENYLNNSEYDDTNTTQLTITLPTQVPGEPVKTAIYTYKLFTGGSYQIKRNHIYIFDLRIAGQTLDPFVSFDLQPWSDREMKGDIFGVFLNLDQTTAHLSPANTSDNPAIIHYVTDHSSVTLDWSRVDPLHNINTSVPFIPGSNGEIHFSWTGNGAPDYAFKDTLYVIVENVSKAVIIEYNPPAGNFGRWIGTFHRWNQTGERIIKIRNTGEWTATVVQGADFIILNGENTADVNWGTASAALGNDPGFDAGYPVTGIATMLSGSGLIYFRVGMKSVLAHIGAKPRYGLIEVATGTGINKIYVRQGEEADYIMRREDPNPANGNSPRPRPYAMMFSPFNLSDPQRGTGGGVISLHNDYVQGSVFNSQQFTDYPTQAGYFFQWNMGAGAVQKAFHPVNSLAAVSGWELATKGSWDRLQEPCPQGYRHPGDSLRSPLTSEMRQSLYATPNGDTYGPTYPDNIAPDNSVWGYYSDGFFDRLPVGASPNGADSTAVSLNTTSLAAPDNANVAYAGMLVYNPTTLASLFLPMSGVREGSGNGALTGSGAMAAYWTSSPNGGNNGWAFYVTPTSFYGYNSAHQSNGASVRCVKYEFGLPGSM